MTDRKTVAGAHARIDLIDQAQNDHEKLCAERYGNIHKAIDELKDGQKWAIRLSVVTLLGVAAKVVIGG